MWEKRSAEQTENEVILRGMQKNRKVDEQLKLHQPRNLPAGHDLFEISTSAINIATFSYWRSLIKYVAQENEEVSWLKLSIVNVYLKKEKVEPFFCDCLWSDLHEKSILYSLEKISLQEDKSGRNWSDDQRPRNWGPWQDVLTVSLEIPRTWLALFFSLAYQNQYLGFFSFLALSVLLSFLIGEENSYSKAFVH